MVHGIFGRDAHWNVIRDDGQFGFHIDAVSFIRRDYRIARPDECIAAALIHERIFVETLGDSRAARFTNQLDVVEIGAAVQPLIGTRQRGLASGLVKGKTLGCARVEQFISRRELRREHIPLIQSGLHRRRNICGIGRHSEVTRDNNQRAITAMF